ncbi:MAG: TolC family protein [Candidatus Latescibacteria bacterium]|nr:TolC family protein [Candidatus Latescibacterota bacterium]
MKALILLLGMALLGFLPVRAETLVMDLESAQAQATKGNHNLQLAVSQVNEADALMLEARSAYLPQVVFSETALRANDPVTAFGLRLRQEHFTQDDFALPALNRPAALSDYQTSLSVRQALFAGGANLAGQRQARAGWLSARAGQAALADQLRWQVADAYWGLVLARQSLEALRQSLEAARAHTRAAETRFTQETSSRADLLAAQAQVAQLEGDEAAAASQAETAAEELSLLLGLDSETQIVPSDTLAPVTAELPVAELEAEALRRRPFLRAALLQVEAARQGVKRARAGHLPQLDLFARLDLDADTPLARQGESWTLGGALTWEIFAGFRTTASLRQARIQHQQAQLRLDQAGQQVRRQVRQACRQIETARLRLAAAAQARRYAGERLRLGALNYGQGLIAVAELLDAQDQDTQAQLRYLEALRQLHSGLAYLEFAANQTPTLKPGSAP